MNAQNFVQEIIATVHILLSAGESQVSRLARFVGISEISRESLLFLKGFLEEIRPVDLEAIVQLALARPLLPTGSSTVSSPHMISSEVLHTAGGNVELAQQLVLDARSPFAESATVQSDLFDPLGIGSISTFSAPESNTQDENSGIPAGSGSDSTARIARVLNASQIDAFVCVFRLYKLRQLMHHLLTESQLAALLDAVPSGTTVQRMQNLELLKSYCEDHLIDRLLGARVAIEESRCLPISEQLKRLAESLHLSAKYFPIYRTLWSLLHIGVDDLKVIYERLPQFDGLQVIFVLRLCQINYLEQMELRSVLAGRGGRLDRSATLESHDPSTAFGASLEVLSANTGAAISEAQRSSISSLAEVQSPGSISVGGSEGIRGDTSAAAATADLVKLESDVMVAAKAAARDTEKHMDYGLEGSLIYSDLSGSTSESSDVYSGSNDDTMDRGLQVSMEAQPPERLVYKRNLKPQPAVALSGDTVAVKGELAVLPVLVRLDTDEELKNQLTGGEPQCIGARSVVVFKRLKILITSHQLNDTMFALRFQLRLYRNSGRPTAQAPSKLIASVDSHPFAVVSHSTQLRPKYPTAVVEEVIPLCGSTSGGTRVAVLGDYFAESPTLVVRFDKTVVVPIYHDSKTLVCLTPQHEPGAVAVRVANNGGYWSETHAEYIYGDRRGQMSEVSIANRSVDRSIDKIDPSHAGMSKMIQPSANESGFLGGAHSSQIVDQSQFSHFHRWAALGDADALKLQVKNISSQNISETRVKVLQRVNAQDRFGCTPLHWAVLYGQAECVALLLSLGASALIQNHEGYTSLHVAVLFADTSIRCLDLLLRFGGDYAISALRTITLAGEYPLHLAASNTKTFLPLQRLFAFGCPGGIDARDFDGETPLHYAVRSQSLNNVKLLLRAGASILPVSEDGETPFHLAQTFSYVSISNVLLQCLYLRMEKTLKKDPMVSVAVMNEKSKKDDEKRKSTLEARVFDLIDKQLQQYHVFPLENLNLSKPMKITNMKSQDDDATKSLGNTTFLSNKTQTHSCAGNLIESSG